MKIIKIILLSILCLSTSTAVFAQRVEVEWGPSIKSSKNSYVKNIIGVDDEGFYVNRARAGGLFQLGRSSYFLERYNNNFKKEFAREIQMPGGDPNDMEMEKIYYVNDSLVMFTSYLNRKTLDHYAFASPISSDGQISKELQELDRIDAKNRRRRGSFDFVLSRDSSRFLVYHDEPFERRENERFSIKIFDKDLYELSALNVELPYTDANTEITDKILDDSGNVFMLLRIFEGRGDRNFFSRDYKYLIVLIDPETGAINEYNLGLGDKIITEAGMRLDDNGDLVASGLYSNRGEARAKGIFYMKLNAATKEVEASSTREFDKQFIAEVAGNRRVRDSRELSNFRLDHIVFMKDGSTTIVAEQYYVMVVTNSTPDGVMTTTYHYYHNDIIAANIDTAGEIRWVNKVPKRQHTINQDAFSGYAFGHSKENLFFIYNDHRRNVGENNERRLRYFTNPRNAVVILATINADGEVNKTPLFSAREQRTYTVPNVSFQTSDDEMIIYGIKGRFYKFGKIKMLD